MPDPLRLRRLSVANLRVFGREPQVLELSGPDGRAPALMVLHGGNASGKSSALRGLDLLFRAWRTWLRSTPPAGEDLRISWGQRFDATGFSVSRRDWHASSPDEPVRLVADLEGLPVERVAVTLRPAGHQVSLAVEVEPTPDGPEALDALRDRLEPGSERRRATPFALVDALRRGPWLLQDTSWTPPSEPASVLSAPLVERLYRFSRSLDVAEKARWRSLQALLQRFESLAGLELGIAEDPDSGRRTLTLERPGELILTLDELSSGEQHVLAVCAAIVACDAAIVAVEEPEASLSPAWQEVLRDLLAEQVATGVVGQVLLESHVPTFDGAEVLHFERREDGTAAVRRAPSASDRDRALARRAREQGAEDQWVTGGGYTKLPAGMVDHLGLRQGGCLWFLQHGAHWEAWPEAELAEALGEQGTDGGDEVP